MNVKKSGSLWTGAVVSVDAVGNLITNFKSEDVLPLAKSSKMWLEFPGTKVTVRDMVGSAAGVEKGRWYAMAGPSGFIEIGVSEGNAAQIMGLKAGDPLLMHFRI